MGLYSFAVHTYYISHDQPCMLTLASRLACTVAISVAMNGSIKALILLHCFTCVAIFWEQMHEAVTLLENISEEQIA